LAVGSGWAGATVDVDGAIVVVGFAGFAGLAGFCFFI